MAMIKRVLVAIANHGTGNRQYLDRLIREYRSMPWQVDVVVLSNIPKDLGPDVEVRVGLPAKDPWSLPFAHKQLFADRCEDYDLFIYSEDDTPVSERNIRAFLRSTDVLHEDEIAGFMRYEENAQGRRYFPEVHGHFRWDPSSIRRRGGDMYAFFTNEHSACYLLTRPQLRKAISSGGFLVPPHQEKYDLLVSAATDPYTQCGFIKLICVSQLEQFLVPHLPNKYIGRIGLSGDEFCRQIEMLKTLNGSAGKTSWLTPETKLPRAKWSKDHYEGARTETISLLPPECREILSVGCGWGAAEAQLMEHGARVCAIPLDPVIAACAAARGVELLDFDLDASLEALRSRRFDIVFCTGILHLVPQPQRLLEQLRDLLAPGGRLIVSAPNMSSPTAWRLRFRDEGYRHLGNFARSGVHWTSWSVLQRWLKGAGFRLERTYEHLVGRSVRLNRITFGLGRNWLAQEFTLVAGLQSVEST